VERSSADKVTVFGPLLVLHEIAKQIDLENILGEYGQYLLSLAYILDIPDVSYKKLVEAIDFLEDLNGDNIQERIFRRLKEVLKLSPSGYLYDIADIYFYGVCCSLAKRGYNAERCHRPQIQIGLAVTQGEGIPIFHKVFEGNV
jgi:transposase